MAGRAIILMTIGTWQKLMQGIPDQKIFSQVKRFGFFPCFGWLGNI
jgi:hypothetical protein